MKKKLLIYLLLTTSIPMLLAQPEEFDFYPNTTSANIITTVQVDGIVASGNDWIAAFDEDDICAGAIQLLLYDGQAFCNLQVYGDDFTTPDIDEGINVGETFTFKLWVAATNQILENPIDILPVSGWNAGFYGQPIPGYSYADNVILNFVSSPPTDEDGDGFFTGIDDLDDTDPCNPNINAVVCDFDGDGISVLSDPDDTDSCNPNINAVVCDFDGDGITVLSDPDDTDPCNPNNMVTACSILNPTDSTSNTIWDFVNNNEDHNTLAAGLLALGLDTRLSGDGPFTLFAPTDAAFAALPTDVAQALLNDPTRGLYEVLVHHIVEANLLSTDLSDGQTLTTYSYNEELTVTINDDGIFINDAKVTVADIETENGVVHVIDAVLLPSVPANTIWHFISNSEDHTILETALTALDLKEAFFDRNYTYTFFAPTDAAFEALPAGKLYALLADPEYTELLELISQHTLLGAYPSSRLNEINGQTIITVNTEDLIVTFNGDDIFINNAKITVADIEVSNGIVHVIDAVILLSSISPSSTNPPSEFNFEPNKISAGIIAAIEINGIPASGNDWVAAFDENGNCVGAVQLNNYYGQAFCNLQIYGDDPTTPDIDEGMNAEETFTLQLWIAATGEIVDYPADLNAIAGWQVGLNGSRIPGYNYADGAVINFTINSSTIMGCTDNAACNYNPNATENDDSCSYPETGFSCNGVCLVDCSTISGCTDNTACNYNPNATENDDSCTYPETGYNCSGVCLVDCNDVCVVGSACDDGNEETIFDLYKSDCSCAGREYDEYYYGPSFLGGDFSLSILFACNCTYGIDVDGDNVIDLVRETIQITGDDSPFTVSNSSGNFYDAEGNSLNNEALTSLIRGPSLEFWIDANSSTYTLTITNSLGETETISGGLCGSCPVIGGYNGVVVEDCDGIVGAACDDGDPNTTNDSYNADCECVGLAENIDCMSAGGILTLVEGGAYAGMNYICAGDCAAVSASDFLLQAGQGVKIVWHTNGDIDDTNIPPANVIGSGSFFCNEDGIKQTVYATAFGALKDADDEIDYSDYCLTYSNTIAVNFLAPITLSVAVQCDNGNGNFTYTFNVDDGLPACTPGEFYTIEGDYFSGQTGVGETQSVGPIADGTEFTITVTDSNGCIASYTDEVSCTKLPITLALFAGDAINQGNLIKWLTATEINNAYFSLQASTNGVDFTTIKTIDGKGNSNIPTAYNYLDRTAAKGTTYYRLVQTDFDGTQSKSKVIDVTRGEAAFSITDLYPVPTSGELTLQYVAPEQRTINIEVFDLIGHTLIKQQSISDGGINQLNINVADLPSGIYFISVISDTDKVTQKFVIE